MMKVLDGGLYTSVQDLGRFEYRNYGVPVAGCMDEFHAQLANQLLGNDENDAVLELTLQGGSFQFDKSTVIVITGANLSPTLNQQSVPLNTAISVSEGDIVTFGKRMYGVRAYLAVKGGFQTEKILKSRSFYDGITPKHVIKKGNLLPYTTHAQHSKKLAHISVREAIFNDIEISVYEGPEFELLSKEQQKQLFQTSFSIGLNNRMAYQLEEKIANELPSIITSAVLPGTIQLTPSGKLIILMKDCQTTGGYPRILQLDEKSIAKLSQKHTKDTIHFTKLSIS